MPRTADRSKTTQQLSVERERVRHACLEAVRHVSLYGPHGVGRKSSDALYEEIMSRIRTLDLVSIQPTGSDNPEVSHAANH